MQVLWHHSFIYSFDHSSLCALLITVRVLLLSWISQPLICSSLIVWGSVAFTPFSLLTNSCLHCLLHTSLVRLFSPLNLVENTEYNNIQNPCIATVKSHICMNFY